MGIIPGFMHYRVKINGEWFYYYDDYIRRDKAEAVARKLRKDRGVKARVIVKYGFNNVFTRPRIVGMPGARGKPYGN